MSEFQDRLIAEHERPLNDNQSGLHIIDTYVGFVPPIALAKSLIGQALISRTYVGQTIVERDDLLERPQSLSLIREQIAEGVDKSKWPQFLMPRLESQYGDLTTVRVDLNQGGESGSLLFQTLLEGTEFHNFELFSVAGGDPDQVREIVVRALHLLSDEKERALLLSLFESGVRE
jgi:hypothetical protein